MNHTQPLGLPPGSVRAILALTLVLAVVASFFLRGSVPETLSTMAGMVIGFYFNKSTTPPPANGEQGA